jgi:hypothetical protein
MLPNHTIKKASALALALTAIAPAAASATLVEGGSNGTTPTQPTSIVRVVAPNNGFDWADAGIGAGGALALSLVGLGAALTVTQRRAHRPTTPAAPTS